MADSPQKYFSAPVIILVETQLGENIGMCARAMLNCGLDRLRLVSPRDGWPNPAALATAADAYIVIEQVQCFDNIEAAVADCQRVFATTARQRRLQIPNLNVGEAINELRRPDIELGCPPKSAIVFGPEASGLDNETLSHADRLIHFPTNPDFSSLNLAQAVLLFAWEWWRTPVATDSCEAVHPLAAPPAPKSDTAIFLNRLEAALDETGFFLTPEQRPDTVRNLRTLFTRINPNPEELRMLHGVLTALRKS